MCAFTPAQIDSAPTQGCRIRVTVPLRGKLEQLDYDGNAVTPLYASRNMNARAMTAQFPQADAA